MHDKKSPKKRITIKVTQKDIKKGTPNSSMFCPIARAYRRQTKRKGICVGYNSIEDDFGCVDLPKRAQAFVVKFDHDEKVKPFSFNIFPVK